MLPRLHVFNVGNEVTLPFASKVAYTLPLVIRKMRYDLAALPRIVANETQGDAVLVPSNYPKIEHETLKTNIPLIDIQTIQAEKKHYSLALYGNEPPLEMDICKQLTDIVIPTQPPLTQKNLQSFYNRSLEEKFLTEYYPELAPHWVNNQKELTALLNTKQNYIAKTPFSSSGRGIFNIKLGITDLGKIPYPCLIEPYYRIDENWANEFYITPNGEVQFLGLSCFVVQNFRYLYNIIAPQSELTQKLFATIDITTFNKALVKQTQFISSHIAPFYRGAIGVDMFTTGGKLFPCCEFNVRYTMGHYALKLSQLGFNNTIFSIAPVKRLQQLKNKKHTYLTPLTNNSQFIALLEYV